MPMPVSLTATSTCELTRSSRTWTLPPRFVNFTAFDSRFHSTCCRRSGSPETGAASGSSTVSMRTPLAVGRRRHRVDGASDNVRKLDWLNVQPNLSRDDPGDVEHVFDDLRQGRRVALDRLDGFVLLVRCDDAGPQHAGVAEDRIQRRSQLVREAGEKVVLDPTGLLHAHVHPSILERDRCPRCDPDCKALMLFGEASDAGMAEEQAPDDITRTALDRHGQIASHWQMAIRHAEMRRVVTVARILRDVGASHDGRSLEGRCEHFRIARHRKLRKRLARNAGNRKQRVRLAVFIHQVVKERAEFGRRQLRGGIGHRLHDFGAIQVGGDDGADVVQGFRDGGILLQQPEPLGLRLFEGRHITRDF